MKKITLAALIALSSASVYAQQTGGFTGTTALSTVKDAQTMKDDQWIMLEGFIDQRIDHDKYIFRDNTGTC